MDVTGEDKVTQLVQQWQREARLLCREYIGHRLYRAGCMATTPGLVYSLPPTASSSEASQRLRRLGQRLEAAQPGLFVEPLAQLGLAVASADTVARAFRKFARQLLLAGPATATADGNGGQRLAGWGRPVALFCMAGAFAVDCVRRGHPEHVDCVVDSLVGCVTANDGGECGDPLGYWLAESGGWVFPDVDSCSATSNAALAAEVAKSQAWRGAWHRVRAHVVRHCHRLFVALSGTAGGLLARKQ